MPAAPTSKIRDLEKSRKEILDAAFMEVFTRGFQGTSVDQIIAKTSLTKGAFYHQFPTKMDLGYALVEEVIEPMILERWLHPLTQFENPIEGILLRLKTLIGEAKPRELAFGCPLHNLVQEMAPIDAGFQQRVRHSLRVWIQGLEKELNRGKQTGFIRKNVDSRAAAHFIVMAHEGFYGMLKGVPGKGAFTALYDSLELYLGTLSIKSSS